MAPFNNYFAYYQPVSIKQEGYTVDPCLIISIGKCIHTHYLSLSLYTVSEQQLRWAKAEENPLFLCLFGRLAELTWMGNELIRQFQDKV